MSTEAATPEVAPSIPADEAGTGTPADSVARAFAAVDAGGAAPSETDEAVARLKGDAPGETKPAEEAKTETKDAAAQPADKGKEKPEQKAETKGPERDENGRFKAKGADAKKDEVKPEDKAKPEAKADEATKSEKEAEPSTTPTSKAPKRLKTEAAMKAFDEAPAELQEQILRMESELTEGISRNADAAKKYEPLARYEQLAQSVGLNLHQVLDDYANGANLVRQDPVRFLEMMMTRHGHSVQDVAAKLLGRDPNAEVAGLQRQLAELTQDYNKLVGEVRETRSASEQQMHGQVEEFAAAQPRWKELEGEVFFQLKQGHPDMPADPMKRLEWAYKRAELIQPAASLSVPDADAQTGASTTLANADAQTGAGADRQSAQTDTAAQSISGSPTNGKTPVSERPASATPDEAVKRAFASVNL